MSTKYLHYAELSETHGKHVVDSTANWTDMLTTAARLYKYSFDEQLLIHAQKPDAVACAELNLWNKPMGRYVKKGTKGIALLDDSGGKQRLRYVFDVADTAEGRYNPKTPYIWQMKPEHETLVYETLGIPLSDIPNLAAELASEYVEENHTDILEALEEAGFTDYEAFYATLTDSAAYMIMSRCGLDTSAFTDENSEKFQHIGSFDTSKVLKALGEGISTVSENVLRDIEITIKNHDREQARLALQNERSNSYDREYSQNTVSTDRNNVQLAGGLSDTRHRNPGGRGQPAVIDQVGNDAERLLEETPPDNLHGLENGGETVSSLFGNRGTSERPIGIDDEAVSRKEPNNRGFEENRPDGLGGANERLESSSGGSNQNGIDLQLNDLTETPSVSDTAQTGGVFAFTSIDPAMSVITDDEINNHLKTGSNVESSKFRIFSHFLQENETADRVRFLREEYGTGGGRAFPNVDRSYENHDGRGITFTKGNLLEPSAEARLSWTNVAGRIDRLIKDGEYMTQAELDRLPSYERQILGAGVSRFYDNTDVPPPIPMLRSGDFWGEAQRIGDLLDNPEIRSALLASMAAVMEETPADHRFYNSRMETLDNLTAFNNGEFTLFPNYEFTAQPPLIGETVELIDRTVDTAKIVNETQDSDIAFYRDNQRRTNSSADYSRGEQMTLFSMFPTEESQISSIAEAEKAELAAIPVTITQDDIDNAIIAWNGDIDSKTDLYKYISTNDFIRSLYAADYLRSAFGGESDGLTVSKEGAEPIIVSWGKVQQRIGILTDEGQFLTPQEWDHLREREQAAQAEPSIISGLPITRAISETFRNPNEPRNDFIFARDENGELYISNRYFIIKPEEQDISKVTEQLNLYRNADRRRKELPPLVAVENNAILDVLSNIGELHQLDQSRNYSFKPYRDSTTDQILFTDGTQYFGYNKDFIDVFGNDGIQINVQDAETPDYRKHRLVVKDDNGTILGIVLPVMVSEHLYQTLAETFPLDVPYKTELERIKENSTNDPYIGREFFDGRDNYIVASLELNHISGTSDEPEPRYILREIRKDGTLSNGGIYVKVDEMEERIALWDSNRETAEVVKAQAELRAQIEAKAREVYENTHGFADNLPPMQKARVLETLDKGFVTKEYGNLNTKNFIETAIQNGRTVEAVDVLKKKYQNGDYGLADYLSEYVHNNYDNAKARKAFVSVTRNDADNEYAQFLHDKHPYLHYMVFHDKSVLPDSYFSTEYRLNTSENTFYSISKTAHDYGKYLIDNKIFSEPEQPTAEKLLSMDGTDYYLFHFPENAETPAALSHETLSLITEKADRYVICADVCYLSPEDLTRFNIEFRKIPRDFGLLSTEIQERISEMKPELATALISAAREKAITDTAPKIPPDRTNDIILYQIGNSYEAYGEHADILASQLPLVLIDNADEPLLNYVSFPIDKLQEYTDNFHENSNRNFTISTELLDGTRDITHITHPFWDLSEWEQYVHVVSKNDKGDYTEPFVVIENSESPNFANYEWLTFADADTKFKEVETAEHALREADGKSGGYHKTNGTIFYKENPDDTELSTYSFRYDIGDYYGEQSGLFNHINNFWTNVQDNIRQGETAVFSTYTQEDVDSVQRMLAVLQPQSLENAITPKNEIPVYKNTWRAANDNGEREQFIASRELNSECGQAIDAAISANTRYGEMAGTQYVDAKEAARSVIAEYGAERVAWVIASNVNYASWDGRLSNANKEWARDFDTPTDGIYHLNAHKTIVDSFVSRFRELEQEIPSPVIETEQPQETAQETRYQGTPLWQDYQFIKEQNPDRVLFYRLGDFYEVMGSDARSVADALNLSVTGRDVGLAERVPLIGVPQHRLDEYVEMLTNAGFGVAIRHGQDEIETRSRNIWSAEQAENSDIVTSSHNGTELPSEDSRLDFTPSTQKQSIAQPVTEPSERRNFKITDPHLGEGGAKIKYGYNIEAIKTLQDIESENRLATPEEQGILSRYVGWGGLQEAFDDSKPGWAREYQELQSLLSPEEYAAAKASVLNAHYTSPTVISAMYDTLERMGVKGGNILEPAMGAGNFFGMLPDSMQNAKLYGVELDSITGRIAKQLYQRADIKVMGFEKTTMPDSFFDAAVGNVPFGGFGVVDKKYDKHKFMIHDYFFAKTLDQVRPGGIVAFVTSKGTMDKANPAVRKYLAQRADLLGAVRLPNTAFLKNAGTEVTSDIIFLQKRDSIRDIEPPWVHLGQVPNAGNPDKPIAVNSYFADNPHMILGKMSTESGSRMYGNENSTTCIPIEGADLAEQLKTALSFIEGQITEIDRGVVINDAGEIDILDLDDSNTPATLPADPSVKNFSYTLVDETVYFRENSIMRPVEMPAATLERVKGMVGLRDTAKKLIDLQLYDGSDWDISAKQRELNTLYDDFTKKNGLLNASANARAFNEDSSYYLLASLEVIDENGALERKSDIFTKRTIKQEQEITSVDTSAEALAVSIARKANVDMEYMAELTGFTEEKIAADLQGVIFKNIGGESVHGGVFTPERAELSKFCMDAENEFEGYKKFFETRPYVTADEYLSGNVREKLEFAKSLNHTLTQRAAETGADSGRDWASLSPQLPLNIAALTEAQPKDLDASEIAVRLGSTWVDKEYYQQFAYELLETPYYQKNSIKVEYSGHTGEWNISGKTVPAYNDVLVNTTYGTERANAYKIIEDTLNLRDVRVYDTKFVDGKEVREVNKKETTLALQKQDAIKEAFKEWVFKDPDRRQALVAKYNKLFNSTRTRQFDGSHIEFAGASPEIKLRPHQRGAIARILYGGNTLLAHEVGAGKSFEMIGAAMESKRLGLCNKSMLVVPNHIIEDMASEFMRLYPSANILVASKKDFEPKNRKKFCARIATGDYDCVIIGHSQFERIPLSKERQERLLSEQIDELTTGIDQLKRSRGERFTIKQMEKSRKNLEVRLSKLTDDSRKDDVVTFEQLGVDRLFVDEAHNYKNLFLVTKMRNVAGLSTSEAQKSSDLFMKCRYLDELTGGKGTIFATGTPISNSLAEMYTVQRYLQYDTLQSKGMGHFDNWASTFGETVTAVELAPEGSGYRARTRFAKFQNLPELMTMFGEVADIKTADTLDLPRPKANYKTIVAEPSDIQREMVENLSERATAVQKKEVDPSTDNMLCITSDGRKIGLDQRLMNPMCPDNPGSKVNLCMENVFSIWDKTSENRSTQIVFCDFSTPKGNIWALSKDQRETIKDMSEPEKKQALENHIIDTAKSYAEGNYPAEFNVYDDIKAKLILKGVPADEIAFIHNYDTEAQKKELFAKVRSGKVRVLLGSTAKCGSGTNVQDRLIATHDLDCPWRPADLAQRAGRVERQGNQNPEVDIFRYVTDATFDSYLFQTVQKKQEFISQIMTSKSPVRTCDDMDEQALSYAEIKALCAGNPLIAEKMGLDVEVAKLKMLKANHQSQQYRLEDNLRLNFPKQIESTKAAIDGYKADIERLETKTVKVAEGISPMTIGKNSYSERKDAGAALIEACRSIQGVGPDKVGSYRGFEVSISFDTFNKEYKCNLKGAMTYTVPLGSDPAGNIIRIDNALEKISVTLNSTEARLETLYSQVENAKTELTKPFPQEAELAQKSARLVELDNLLSLDGKDEPAGDSRGDGAEIADDTSAKAPEKVSVQTAPTQTPKEGIAPVTVKTDVKKDEVTAAQPPQDKVKKKSYDER